mmetsp:Transcript_19472/g.40454  ORF Transcript_19472/g.40454 Transcript_19472/m.40454 type:complete len:337 (-) Transcript_19472:153-1163(-)
MSRRCCPRNPPPCLKNRPAFRLRAPPCLSCLPSQQPRRRQPNFLPTPHLYPASLRRNRRCCPLRPRPCRRNQRAIPPQARLSRRCPPFRLRPHPPRLGHPRYPPFLPSPPPLRVPNRPNPPCRVHRRRRNRVRSLPLSLPMDFITLIGQTKTKSAPTTETTQNICSKSNASITSTEARKTAAATTSGGVSRNAWPTNTPCTTRPVPPATSKSSSKTGNPNTPPDRGMPADFTIPWKNAALPSFGSTSMDALGILPEIPPSNSALTSRSCMNRRIVKMPISSRTPLVLASTMSWGELPLPKYRALVARPSRGITILATPNAVGVSPERSSGITTEEL